MSSPSGKPSPEGTRRSSRPVDAMAIEDADTVPVAGDVPIIEVPASPSERSRSEKREVAALVPNAALPPQTDTTRFSHRGYNIHATREGVPSGSNHVPTVQNEFHSTNTMNLNQTQNNQVHVNAHDPAITQLIEQVAEARHREAFANTESAVKSMVSELNHRFHAEEEAASHRMHQMMMLAERRETRFREELAQQGEEYKRVLDGNARQSNATKDQQLNLMKQHYERQDEARLAQMIQMESIIQQQSEQIKAQQMQTESMNMQMRKLFTAISPAPIPIVQTATAVTPVETEVKISAPLSAFAPAGPLPNAAPVAPDTSGSWEMLGTNGFTVPEVPLDPPSSITGLRSPTLPATSIAPSKDDKDDDDKGNKPNPGGNDPDGDDPDDKDDKGDKDNRDKGGKKLPRGSRRPPGGGPGDGDDGDGPNLRTI